MDLVMLEGQNLTMDAKSARARCRRGDCIEQT